ncbi:MAG: hypothetical protein HLUCCO16_13165 [Phormidium sp. OSCR]|nr:MAG: hypothetical protein HLUCCO16_13165 [Phormidium sp. OSCR]
MNRVRTTSRLRDRVSSRNPVSDIRPELWCNIWDFIAKRNHNYWTQSGNEKLVRDQFFVSINSASEETGRGWTSMNGSPLSFVSIHSVSEETGRSHSVDGNRKLSSAFPFIPFPKKRGAVEEGSVLEGPFRFPFIPFPKKRGAGPRSVNFCGTSASCFHSFRFRRNGEIRTRRNSQGDEYTVSIHSVSEETGSIQIPTCPVPNRQRFHSFRFRRNGEVLKKKLFVAQTLSRFHSFRFRRNGELVRRRTRSGVCRTLRFHSFRFRRNGEFNDHCFYTGFYLKGFHSFRFRRNGEGRLIEPAPRPHSNPIDPRGSRITPNN